MLRNTTFAVLTVLLAAATAANAAPIVTMSQTAMGGGVIALDFRYSASAPPAEFTNYRLIVTNANGNLLSDPVQAQVQDQGSDANDTFMNTVGSFLGAGSASYTFNSYQPTGFTPSPQPTALIDWSVSDTLPGDTNAVGGGAPFHLARVLTLPGATGVAEFRAFDTTSQGVPSVFAFTYGEVIPEPTSFALLGLAMVGGFGFLRRRS